MKSYLSTIRYKHKMTSSEFQSRLPLMDGVWTLPVTQFVVGAKPNLQIYRRPFQPFCNPTLPAPCRTSATRIPNLSLSGGYEDNIIVTKTIYRADNSENIAKLQANIANNMHKVFGLGFVMKKKSLFLSLVAQGKLYLKWVAVRINIFIVKWFTTANLDKLF